MRRIYNVVLQSAIPSQTTVGEIFYYDWGQLLEGQYKVSFTFISAIATLVNTTVANIFLDLGQDTDLVSASGQQYRSGYLGMLRYSGTGASNYLFAGLNDNPPTYLMNKPANNRVFVQIHANTGTFETNYSVAPGAYTLCLSFELQE